MPAAVSTTRTARLDLRATPEQEAVLRRAAGVVHAGEYHGQVLFIGCLGAALHSVPMLVFFRCTAVRSFWREHHDCRSAH